MNRKTVITIYITVAIIALFSTILVILAPVLSRQIASEENNEDQSSSTNNFKSNSNQLLQMKTPTDFKSYTQTHKKIRLRDLEKRLENHNQLQNNENGV
ncbi:hypothetical protein M0813_25257 [Anaeramoeba flamelloides]|uniref:Uncharacterized protein n=1 Tax=Anaeramoeba flamelloides TaxID=1746091 RepID=A0AAV7ZTT4_9EUKA|nr:hypothetical protein M0812_10356 [Anaeramoeba flamelloides]KAJ6239371.1 hypothetical protein M0813_25257 [Anaeramoeba flamelloides]